MDISNAQRARVLVHALPYIQDYSGKIVVVKYGGNAMVSEHLKDSVIRDICLLQLIGVKVVLVHGGGPEIAETLGKMGKKSAFVDGVRVTDEEAVGVALMVLAGKINKTLVNLIELKGGSAIGLSGLDGHMLKATVKKPELGYVGEITDVNVQPILDVIDKGYIPVVSTVGYDDAGNIKFRFPIREYKERRTAFPDKGKVVLFFVFPKHLILRFVRLLEYLYIYCLIY